MQAVERRHEDPSSPPDHAATAPAIIFEAVPPRPRPHAVEIDAPPETWWG